MGDKPPEDIRTVPITDWESRPGTPGPLSPQFDSSLFSPLDYT